MKARATASSSFPSMDWSPLTSHTWKQRSSTNSRARTSSALNEGDEDEAEEAATGAAESEGEEDVDAIADTPSKLGNSDRGVQ